MMQSHQQIEVLNRSVYIHKYMSHTLVCSNHTLVVPECFKDDNASQWKVGNSTPAPSETPEPIVTKICMGDYVGDPYRYAKFHHDTTTPLCPPNMRKCASSDSASFFLVLPGAYCQDPCTDFHDQYVK